MSRNEMKSGDKRAIARFTESWPAFTGKWHGGFDMGTANLKKALLEAIEAEDWPAAARLSVRLGETEEWPLGSLLD